MRKLPLESLTLWLLHRIPAMVAAVACLFTGITYAVIGSRVFAQMTLEGWVAGICTLCWSPIAVWAGWKVLRAGWEPQTNGRH
jgi:hypothetical protein